MFKRSKPDITHGDERPIKTFYKSIASISIVIFILVFVTAMIRFIFTGNILPAPGILRMEMSLRKNEMLFDNVIEYLIATGFDNITIWRTNVSRGNLIEMSVGFDRAFVSDEDVTESIHLLFQRGYRIISRNEYVVKFQRWSNLDAGRGIVYSINGNTPREDAMNFLVEILPLSQEGWYFYIEDFNEWRRRN